MVGQADRRHPGSGPTDHRPAAGVPAALTLAPPVSDIHGETSHCSFATASRTDRIANSFKCPTCQGLSVAQSKANTAKAIYAEIQRQVEAGQTDGQIRTYLVSRFGEQQLLRPETTGIGSIAWIAPVVVLVTAFGLLLMKFRQTKITPVEVSEADRNRVADALRQFEENRP